MKPVLFLCLALVPGVAALSARAGDVLPQPAPGDRYLKMADRSPFAPPTAGPVVAAATPPPPGPKWSDQLTLALLTQRGSVYYATIYDKASDKRFLLQSNQEDAERHLAVSSVQWSDPPTQTTVTLRHDGEFAPIRFDPSAAPAPTAILPVPNAPTTLRPPGISGMPPGITPPRFAVPPPPPSLPNSIPPNNVQRRSTPIRTTPTVTAPAIRPPASVRRPVDARNEDQD